MARTVRPGRLAPLERKDATTHCLQRLLARPRPAPEEPVGPATEAEEAAVAEARPYVPPSSATRASGAAGAAEGREEEAGWGAPAVTAAADPSASSSSTRRRPSRRETRSR